MPPEIITLDPGTLLAQWDKLFAAALPAVVALFQQPQYPKWLRYVVTFIVYVVGSAVTAYLKGYFTPGAFLQTFLGCLMVATTSWVWFWKPFNITNAIEEATTPPAQ